MLLRQCRALLTAVSGREMGPHPGHKLSSSDSRWRKFSRLSIPDDQYDLKKPEIIREESLSEEDKQPDEDLKRLRFKDFRRFILGILAITGIAVSSALLNYYAKNTSTTYFHAPLFLIWFRSNWRIAAFPIFVFLKRVYQTVLCKCVKQDSVKNLVRNGTKIYGEKKITARIFFIDIAGLSTLSIAVQYLTFAPYHFVSAGNATALNASNVAWVYIFSVIVLGVDIMPVKVVAVLCSLIGVVLLAYHEGFTNPDWESAVMIILGAMITAVYQVLYKKRIGGTTDLGQITFSVSALACFTLFTMWPIALILYLTRAERWEWETIPWDIVCKNSAASMAFNYLINLGVAWTNPVFTSLGFLLAVPLAHFFDASLAHKQFADVEIAGTILIGVGFLVCVFADRISLNCVEELWTKIFEKTTFCRTAARKIIPEKGVVVINETPPPSPPISIISIEVDHPKENHSDSK